MKRRFPRHANRVLLTTTGLALAVSLPLAGCSRKAEPVEVVIAIDETAGALADATILVDYSQASAHPLIAGGEPACASIQPHIDMRFADDGGGAMSVDASSSQGFTGPLEIAVCRMVPDSEGTSADAISAGIRVSLLTATGPDGRKVSDDRIARAGTQRQGGRMVAGGAEPADAPIGRIEPSRPDGAGTDHRPAVPQGDPTRRQPSAEGNAARAGSAPAAPAGSGQVAAPYEVEETVEELLARRGTGTERRASSSVMAELDQKAAALADSEQDGSGDGAEQDPESAVNDPSAVTYSVQVGVTSGAGRLAALQFDVTYSGDGEWIGGAGSVVCSTHPQVALATYNNRGSGWYSAAMIDLEGFDAVGPISTCRIRSRDAVRAGDFSVVVIDASTPDASPPDPMPTMAVTDIRAGS